MTWLAYIPPLHGVPYDPIDAALFAAFGVVLVWPIVVDVVRVRIRGLALGIPIAGALALFSAGIVLGPLILIALLAASLLARLVGRACSRIGEGLFDVGHPVPVLQRPWRGR